MIIQCLLGTFTTEVIDVIAFGQLSGFHFKFLQNLKHAIVSFHHGHNLFLDE